MKHCPHCRRVFDDENLFCLNDGTQLEDFPQSGANSIPTQYFPPLQREAASQKSFGKVIYWVCGALVLVIGILSIVIYALVSNPVSAGQSNDEKDKKAAENRSVPAPLKNETPESANKPELPPFTPQTVREL